MTEEVRRGLRSVEKKKKLVKSKQRVADHGEVFTPDWLVEDMLKLVEAQTSRIDSRFLEPACGDGNFLAPVLEKKLAEAERSYGRNRVEFELYAIRSLSSVYGVDILADNAQSCRDRLQRLWGEVYKRVCKQEVSSELLELVSYILDRNIVQGNALSMKKVNEKAEDIEEPIIFSEWSWIGKDLVIRRDFRLDQILKDKAVQASFDMASDFELALEFAPMRPVRKFMPMPYRKLSSVVEEEVTL